MNALLGKLTSCKIEDTAFAWRDAIFWILIKGYTQEQDQPEQQGRYVRWIYKKFLQNGLTNPQTGLGRVYVNFKDPTLSKKDTYQPE